MVISEELARKLYKSVDVVGRQLLINHVPYNVCGVVAVSYTHLVANVTPLSRNGVISFTVRLDDDNYSGLRSGLKTDVYILCDLMEDVTRIKNGTFYTGPGSYELFVMTSDDELERRTVRLGESNYEYRCV